MYQCVGWYNNKLYGRSVFVCRAVFQADVISDVIVYDCGPKEVVAQKWLSDHTFTIQDKVSTCVIRIDETAAYVIKAIPHRVLFVENLDMQNSHTNSANLKDFHYFNVDDQVWTIGSQTASGTQSIYRTLASAHYSQMVRIQDKIICIGSILSGLQRPTLDRDACITVISNT
jgi:hypothetical protein